MTNSNDDWRMGRGTGLASRDKFWHLIERPDDKPSHYIIYDSLDLTCPDCNSTNTDHIGGNNYRCECGHHFAQ